MIQIIQRYGILSGNIVGGTGLTFSPLFDTRKEAIENNKSEFDVSSTVMVSTLNPMNKYEFWEKIIQPSDTGDTIIAVGDLKKGFFFYGPFNCSLKNSITTLDNDIVTPIRIRKV